MVCLNKKPTLIYKFFEILFVELLMAPNIDWAKTWNSVKTCEQLVQFQLILYHLYCVTSVPSPESMWVCELSIVLQITFPKICKPKLLFFQLVLLETLCCMKNLFFFSITMHPNTFWKHISEFIFSLEFEQIFMQKNIFMGKFFQKLIVLILKSIYSAKNESKWAPGQLYHYYKKTRKNGNVLRNL